MRLINDNQVIVAPIQPGKVYLAGHALLTGKVGVIEHIIAQAVRRYGIVDVVAFVSRPVFRQLFGTQH